MSRLNVLLVTLALVVVVSACSGEEASSETSLSSTTAPSTTQAAEATTTTSPASSTTTPAPTSTTTTVSIELSDELVPNGDFASGGLVAEGWEVSAEGSGQIVDYVTEADDRHISFFGPLVEDAPWPEARLTREFDVEPHTDYLLSVEARTITRGRLFLALVFRDEDGDEILLRGPGVPEVSSSDWARIEAILESPVEAASAYVVMRLPIRPELSDADFFSVDVNSVSVKRVLG